MQKVNLSEKLASFQDLWSPKGVGAVNDFHVKLVKLKGEFVWHSHDVEDELFLVLVVLLVAIGLVLLARHAAARRWLA